MLIDVKNRTLCLRAFTGSINSTVDSTAIVVWPKKNEHSRTDSGDTQLISCIFKCHEGDELALPKSYSCRIVYIQQYIKKNCSTQR